MSRHRAGWFAFVLGILGAGCNETLVVPIPVDRIEMTPASLVLEVNQEVGLNARLMGGDGVILNGYPIHWTSLDPAVAEVDEAGRVRARSLGTTRVVARVGNVEQDVPVEVARLRWLDVTRTQLHFQALAGADDPADQEVQVLAGGAGEIDELAIETTYAAGTPAGWLDARLASSSTPTVLRMGASPQDLTPGTYTATVNFSSPAADPKALSVTLQVSTIGQPTLVLTPATVQFTAVEGGADPDGKTIDVRNGGSGSLSGLSVPPNPAPWLAAELDHADAPATMTLRPRIASIAAGVHTVQVLVTAAGGISAVVDVRLEIGTVDDPSIGLEATAVSFQASEGGPDPSPDTLQVFNAGAGSLDDLTAAVQYAAGQPAGWLNAALAGATAPTMLTLSASVGTLTAGSYNAIIQLSATGAAGRSVSVTLIVAPGVPSIETSQDSAQFTGTAGGSNPAPTQIQIVNSGPGSLSGLGANVTYAQGQPAGWLMADLSSATAPATLTLDAAIGPLAPGTYRANVTMTATGAAPVTIPVSLTIQSAPGPVITINVPDLTFQGVAGGASPDSVVVQITNGGGGALTGLSAQITYGTGQPTGWLTATLSSTTAPANLTVKAALGSLPAGTHTAIITLSSPVATSSVIAITLTVAPGTPLLSLSLPSVPFVAVAGGLSTPPWVDVLITNLGTGLLTGLSASVSYASGEPTGWLQVDLQATTAPTTLRIAASASGLPAGLYTATVSVTASGVAAVNLIVTIAVSPAVTPIIGLDVGGVTFTAQVGGDNPAPVPVQVTNLGILSLTGITASVAYDAGQPGGWLSATLSGTVAPTTLTLSANAAGLAPGLYSATVTVNALLASPRSFPVALLVTSGSPPPPDRGSGR